ncbi:MAG: biotin--[acetyl-CoA-carboxylase] ligase [Phycisphaerales bacterium]|nr:MAG: biotin--[acetyl-CoA-carboxylase] ligase [Phycisphaerales bacterium]
MVSECTSTNDLALQGSGEGGDGEVFLAERQTAGRGRLGRRWEAPRASSVLCSVRLLEKYSVARWVHLSLAAGIAVHDAVRQAAAVSATLRWPNDLMVGDRKLAGILIEARPHRANLHVAAVGVGINCLQHRGHFPPELRGRATSLDMESSQPIDRREVVRCLIAALDHWLDPEVLTDPQRLKDEWCGRSRLIGLRVRLRERDRVYEGIVVDLDPNAGILVALDEGVQRLFCPLTTSSL